MKANFKEFKNKNGFQEAIDVYYSLGLDTFFEVKNSDLKKYYNHKLESNIFESLTKMINEIDSKELLLKNIKQKFYHPNNTNIFALSDFFFSVKKNRRDENHLSSFLSRKSQLFNSKQIVIAMILFSFDFKFDLEDLNAYFSIFDKKTLDEMIKEEISEITPKQIKGFIKTLVRDSEKELINFEYFKNAKKNKKQSFIQVLEVIKKFVILLYFFSYKTLTVKCSLDSICKTLNKTDFLTFNKNFWSKHLLKMLLYQYAQFDLRCKLTKLFYENGIVPFFFCKPNEESQLKQPDLIVNPFVEYFTENNFGILSLAIGSATSEPLGKSDLVNKILYTNFEVDKNDPFRSQVIDIDFGIGFHPNRPVTVIDSNIDDLKIFKTISRIVNCIILQIMYKDLITDYDKIYERLEKIVSSCEKKGQYVLIIVRDWDDYLSFEVNKYFKVPKIFKIESNSHSDDNESCEKSDPETSEIDNIFFEIKKLVNFNDKKTEMKKIKIQDKVNTNLVKQKFIQSKLFENSDQIFLFKIKANPDEKSLEPLQCKLNSLIYKMNTDNYNFSKKNVAKLILKLRKKFVNSENEDYECLVNNLSGLIENYKIHVDSKEQDCFSFNVLWNEKHENYLKLSKLCPTKKNEKKEIELYISQIEKKIDKTSLTQMLKIFINIIINEKNPFTLVFLFEKFLFYQSKQCKINNHSILNIDFYWRNIKIFLEKDREDLKIEEKNKLIEKLEELYIKGYGFEIIDGDHYVFQGHILNKFKNKINKNDTIMTLSIKGPQSSGKSTLMNLQYGTEFKTSVGKCTAGISGYLMRFESDFKSFRKKISKKKQIAQQQIFIMFLDSQGLLSEEVRDLDFDRKIATYLYGISKIILVNFSGDFPDPLKNLLEVSCFSYHQLDLGSKSLFENKNKSEKKKDITQSNQEKNQPKQSVIFISNKNNNLSSLENRKKLKNTLSQHIRDIESRIREIGPNGQKTVFNNDLTKIELLENALTEFYKEENSSLGLNKKISKFSISPVFVSSLKNLKMTSMNSLFQIETNLTSEEKEKWTFQNLSLNLQEIWKHVYYSFEYFEMTSLKNQIQKKRYEEVISDEIQKHIKKYKLDENILYYEFEKALKHTEMNTETKILESVQNEFLKQIFSQEEPKLIVLFSEFSYKIFPENIESLNKRIDQSFDSDISKVNDFFETKYKKMEKRFKEWILEQKENTFEVVRKGYKWKEEDILAIFEQKKTSLKLYDAILKFNLYFFIKFYLCYLYKSNLKTIIFNKFEKKQRKEKIQINENNFEKYYLVILEECIDEIKCLIKRNKEIVLFEKITFWLSTIFNGMFSTNINFNKISINKTIFEKNVDTYVNIKLRIQTNNNSTKLDYDYLEKNITKKFNKFVNEYLFSDDEINFFFINPIFIKKIKTDITDNIFKTINVNLIQFDAEITNKFKEMIIKICFNKLREIYISKLNFIEDKKLKKITFKEKSELKTILIKNFLSNLNVKDKKNINEKNLNKQYNFENQKYINNCFKKFQSQYLKTFQTNFYQPIKKQVDKKVAEFIKNFNKRSLLKRADLYIFQEMITLNENNAYNIVYEYFLDPSKILIELSLNKLEDFCDMIKQKYSKAKQILEYSLLFFKKIKNNISPIGNFDNHINFEYSNDIGKFNKEDKGFFKFYVLKEIILKRKINKNFKHKIQGTNFFFTKDINHFEINVENDFNNFLSQVFTIPLCIDNVIIFLKSTINNLKKLIQNFDDDKIIFDGHNNNYKLESLKKSLKLNIIGCTNKCPLCNRICELEANHKGNHNANFFGHGIINICSSYDPNFFVFYLNKAIKFISKKKINIYKKMKLFFCHDKFDPKENILINNEKMNFEKVKKKFFLDEWDLSTLTNFKKDQNYNTFNKLCIRFWKKFRKIYCEKHNYDIPENQFSFTFFGEQSIFFSEKKNKTFQKDFYDLKQHIEKQNKKNVTQIILFKNSNIIQYVAEKKKNFLIKNKNNYVNRIDLYECLKIVKKYLEINLDFENKFLIFIDDIENIYLSKSFKDSELKCLLNPSYDFDLYIFYYNYDNLNSERISIFYNLVPGNIHIFYYHLFFRNDNEKALDELLK